MSWAHPPLITDLAEAVARRRYGQALEPGNIDLYAQPEVRNADGTISTVHSFSADFGDGEVLLPTVMPDGRHLSEEDAIQEYKATGRHLGKFATPDEATAYAKQLHNDYAAGKYRARPVRGKR